MSAGLLGHLRVARNCDVRVADLTYPPNPEVDAIRFVSGNARVGKLGERLSKTGERAVGKAMLG